jgi:alpha-tubulin suppressor-like RCC1 family protein
VRSSGEVWCWGGSVLQPTAVSGITTAATSVACGGRHTCALLLGGSVVCWGANDYGQLGSGSFSDVFTILGPQQVSGISNAVTITAGFLHTCVLLSNSSIACWSVAGFQCCLLFTSAAQVLLPC